MSDVAWAGTLVPPPDFGTLRNNFPYSEILSETAQLLLQDADPDTLCQAIFPRLRKPFGVDVYFHYLLSADETHLELASSGGSPKVRNLLGTTLDLGSAVCGTVAQQRSPIYVTSVDRREDAMTAFVRSMGVKSYACEPLIANGRLLGTLSFGSTYRSGYSEEELHLFALMAQQISIATDRRTQNERVRQLERLATAGRMSATLAHEINNPLESLGHLLFLLREEMQGGGAKQLLDQAELQIAQLSNTVQHTLELFRGGQQSATKLDLGQVARDLIAGLHLPRHARLDCQIAEEPVWIHAIPGELRQVLFNLLMNAAHFTAPGKAVTLKVSRRGERAEVRVRDEGPGISGETRAKLFQPFFTTRGKEGTGIGLWVSKEMVERAGGRLTFESEPAVRPGTEFVIKLPLAL